MIQTVENSRRSQAVPDLTGIYFVQDKLGFKEYYAVRPVDFSSVVGRYWKRHDVYYTLINLHWMHTETLPHDQMLKWLKDHKVMIYVTRCDVLA